MASNPCLTVNAPLDCRRAGNTYRYTLKTNAPFPTSVIKLQQQSYPRSVDGCLLLLARWPSGCVAMSVQNGFAASLPRPSVQTIAGMALRQATWFAIVAALLFLPAGRWNWPFLCVPLVLGSWLALLPGAANAVLMVIRAQQEDRMLRAELSGYEAYAHRVRYRLLPGVW
jgi:hypothetical protein